MPSSFHCKKTERKERKGCRLDSNSKPITRSSILPPLGFAAPAIVSISCCAVTRFRQRTSIETTSRHSQVYSAVLSLLCWCSQTQLINILRSIYIYNSYTFALPFALTSPKQYHVCDWCRAYPPVESPARRYRNCVRQHDKRCSK